MYFCCHPYVPIAFAIYIRSQHIESNELCNVEPSASDVGTERRPSASNFSCSGRDYKCMKLGHCETDSMAPSQEFICLLWNPRIHWHVTKIPPPDPVPRQLSPVIFTVHIIVFRCTYVLIVYWQVKWHRRSLIPPCDSRTPSNPEHWN
jgi:hypothetical protein